MKFSRLSIQYGLAAVSTALLAALSGTMSARAGRSGAPLTGAEVYHRQCAACHGAKGEGAKRYNKPLTGTQSIGELGKFIAHSMPPGPRKCKAPEARLVAAYIYDAFYSSLAQARNSPARIALSRLTVRQYRNAVADLIGSFQQGEPATDKRGLRAEYYKAKRFQQNERVVQRIDPQVSFDFGTAGPVPDQFDPHQFSIRWQGAVLAPDTGDYEFVVHTDHAVRLWVDDPKKELIDAWVKSGSGTDFRGSIYLLGGRVYPIRLEFSKSTQGVDDTDKQKGKPAPKASISLAWRRPKLAEEVIPQRCLLPIDAAPSFVPSTPFPPDDRSIGYERGTSVSKAWDEATTNAALDAAGYVSAHLGDLAGARDNAPDRDAKVRAFCRQFVERAFRRPLADDLEQFYVERQLKAAPDLTIGVKRVVLLALQSPRFLYREIGATNPDPYDVASRLSFGLWDSLPDQELLKAAAANQLATREQITQQAERMAQDPRAWFKLRQFLLQWLKIDQVPDLVKDPKRYPGFDEAAATDLRTSLELFLQNTAWSDKSDYRDLMLADKVYLNGRLAKLYGVNLPPDAPFQPVSLEPAARCGVMTQPYIMASFAYTDNSSPIHRGVLLARNLLGRTLRPPPAAFIPLPASQHPDMTTRERVTLQTKPAACVGCHGMINPLGFTLEKFDAIGRLRDSENGKPIDCSGSYRSPSGKLVTFGGARDLGKYLATSDEAHSVFVEKLFQHLVKQPIRAYGPRALPDLERAFETNDYSIRKLMVAIMAETALKR
jgi:hypothetical protein